MASYGKEALKVQYEEELKKVYERMLQEEEEKLETLNKEWKMRQEDMLRAIALYDMAVTGGVSRDLNTLNVEIITKIERFKSCDEDTKRKKRIKDIKSNIEALKRLLK